VKIVHKIADCRSASIKWNWTWNAAERKAFVILGQRSKHKLFVRCYGIDYLISL